MTDISPKRYLVEKSEDEPVWLGQRWKNEQGEARITASAAGAVHGQHPFKSVADYAIELLADEAPVPDGGNKDTDRGHTTEPFIRQSAAAQHGVTLWVPAQMYAYEEPGVRLMATVDAMTDPNHSELPWRVFELKSWRGYWKGELKPYWYWQGVHLAICCDVPQIEWAILDSQLEVHHHIQIVTSDERQIHIDACRKFLRYIDAGMTPPEAVFTFAHIQDRFPEGVAKTVELPEETMATFERLAFAKAQQKEGKAAEDACKAEITALMGDAEFAEIGGHVVATWATSHPVKFDQKAFAAAHPALFEQFKKPGTQRTFLAKVKGDDQ